jgi:type VI secretion system protein ImpB
MPASGGQGADKGSRPARVQIWYELDSGRGIEKKEIPFVMMSMADLRGNVSADKPREKLRDRKTSEISAENFDKVMKSYSPRVRFDVPNKLPGATADSMVPVDITFDSMASFSPENLARNVPHLKKLLDARNELQNLLTYMDDRKIEELVQKLRGDENLLKSMMAAPKPEDGKPAGG